MSDNEEEISDDKQKDWWDKIEISAKAVGAILIPIVVGVTAYLWNSERTQRNTAAAMSQIAVSVLIEEPKEFSPDVPLDPLREWAIAVLQSPSNPPDLTDQAANILRQRSLGFGQRVLDLSNVDWIIEPPFVEAARRLIEEAETSQPSDSE